jgi:hypothetical protein
MQWPRLQMTRSTKIKSFNIYITIYFCYIIYDCTVFAHSLRSFTRCDLSCPIRIPAYVNCNFAMNSMSMKRNCGAIIYNTPEFESDTANRSVNEHLHMHVYLRSVG